MRRLMKIIMVCLMGILPGLHVMVLAAPMGTAITYQGRLTDGESPAHGPYDFEFKVFDALTDGIQLDGTQSKDNVPVNDGYFTVVLDFGNDPNALNGEARWLAIGVRPGNDSGSYTPLSPRQELTPTPYALQTRGIFVDNELNVGIGTTTPAGRLHVSTAAIYSDILFVDAGSGQNDLSVDPGSAYTDIIDRFYVVEVTDSSGNPNKFKWSDNLGITWSAEFAMTTSWYDLNHGVRIRWNNTDGHDDGGGATGDVWAWIAFSSNENALVVKEGKLVGIGTATPIWELEVANLAAGGGSESGVAANDARGAIAAYSSTLPAPFDHYGGRVSLFSDGATMGLDLRADSGGGDMRFYTGGPWPANERMRITPSGNVGIGTTIPNEKLEVNGAISTGHGGMCWKTFSGTIDADQNTEIAHGLDASKIIHVSCSYYIPSLGVYMMVPDFFNATRLYWDNTYIYLLDYWDPGILAGQPYRCVVMYVK
jgi:hypothetical protein